MSSPLTSLKELIFPATPREFPGRRAVKISVRAGHVLCAGVLVGSYLLGADAAEQSFWVGATIATGAPLLLLDLHESGVFLLQVRGLYVCAKILLLALLPCYGSATGILLAGLLMTSVVLSHAPSKVRYAVVIRSKHITAKGATSKG